MEVRRLDKQLVVRMQNNSSQIGSFNGDSSFQDTTTRNRRTDHHHHQTLIHNDPGRTVLDPVSTSAAAVAPTSSRSISRSRSPPPTTTTNHQVRYRECLKNHAASMGGVVLDGCGEFMPAGEEGTVEALKCAACECHRNFHRKEIDGESQAAAVRSPIPGPPVVANQNHRYLGGFSSSAPVMMNFGAEYSSSEDLDMCPSNLQGEGGCMQQRLKKRFRTKFSQEQKDKMMEFAETVGWKIQKQDEQQLQQFCSQVGVKRKVFKVWMHNNKQALKKKNHMM